MTRLILAIATPLLLAGCAGEAEMRSVSSQTAQILTTYKTSLQQFAGAQSELNVAAEGRIARLKQMAATRKAETSARVDSWRLANDEEALRQHDIIAGVDAATLLANANPALPAPSVAPLKFEPAEVDSVTKGLVELSKPISPRDRVEQLIAYVTAVRSTYDEDLAAAQAASSATAAKTSAKADEEAAAEAVKDQVPN